ncbi:hypothetical protein ADIARSV_1876 [Arcticibacter svalbardensis MN12-7]|uniref:Uncharacterized protein n=1 Tax=Arcticibacter svalbardensis MN12-7 TaxID=1150600 RepID=R9GTN6_9SPHI|nr:hypothetical protein ADIARSV_1876 [Arcticibacter svalbardensis MN12-7]
MNFYISYRFFNYNKAYFFILIGLAILLLFFIWNHKIINS